MRAQDLMTRPVHTIRPEASLEDAARLMLRHGISALPVVDDSGLLCGMLTASDFTARESPIPFSAYQAPQVLGHWLGREGLERIYQAARSHEVRRVMTTPPISVRPDQSLDDVVRLMLDRGVHHVTVAEAGRPIGMIARRDLLRVALMQR